MSTQELKNQLLKLSFSGIIHNATEGSEATKLILENREIANTLADELDKPGINGIDKGVKNFIHEVLGKVK